MKLLFLPLLALSLQGCGQKGQSVKMMRITIPSLSISIPNNWTYDTIAVKSTIFKAKSPMENVTDAFMENIGVQTVSIGEENPSLDEMMKDMEPALRNSMNDFKIIENKKLKVGNQEAHSLVFTSRHDDLEVCQRQVYVLTGRVFYIITLTAEKQSYSRFQSTFNAIVQSVRFI